MKVNHDARVLEIFAEISRIPRPSHREEKILAWLKRWAQERGYASQSDTAHNLVIRIPASPGKEKAPPVVLQSHVDMVCEQEAGHPHNFDEDPLTLIYDGDWLRADKTSLGADNGIGMALSLAAAEEGAFTHPSLELLFTVSEEVGLDGASRLELPLEGKILLNIDSMDEGVFTVGCAGGSILTSTLPTSFSPLPKEGEILSLHVSHLTGGHSGNEIHLPRGNALSLLARTLLLLSEKRPLSLISLKGGTAHNAIPREALATFRLPTGSWEEASQSVLNLQEALRIELKKEDPHVSLKLTRSLPSAKEALSPESSLRLATLLFTFPHGVDSWSTDTPGLVQTSANLASAQLMESSLSLLSSQRSSLESSLEGLLSKIIALISLAGGSSNFKFRYPAWEPVADSPLVHRGKQVYRDLFGKDPTVETVHAGLECGTIGSKYSGMSMLSFGPTIINPHSPSESLFLPSLRQTTQFLSDLLASF